MTREKIQEKVIAIVAEQLGVDKEKIKLESIFAEDLKADSLDSVEIVMELEDALDITIPDEDTEKLQTVGDIVDYIVRRKNPDDGQQSAVA